MVTRRLHVATLVLTFHPGEHHLTLGPLNFLLPLSNTQSGSGIISLSRRQKKTLPTKLRSWRLVTGPSRVTVSKLGGKSTKRNSLQLRLVFPLSPLSWFVASNIIIMFSASIPLIYRPLFLLIAHKKQTMLKLYCSFK